MTTIYAPDVLVVTPAREPPMPLGVMVFAVLAFGSEALWLGLIGWWLLNLF
jgi:hypothetical protein